MTMDQIQNARDSVDEQLTAEQEDDLQYWYWKHSIELDYDEKTSPE